MHVAVFSPDGCGWVVLVIGRTHARNSTDAIAKVHNKFKEDEIFRDCFPDVEFASSAIWIILPL